MKITWKTLIQIYLKKKQNKTQRSIVGPYFILHNISGETILQTDHTQKKYPTLNALNGKNYSFDTNYIIFLDTNYIIFFDTNYIIFLYKDFYKIISSSTYIKFLIFS